MGAAPLQDPAQRAACADLASSPALRLDGRRVTVSAIGHPDGGMVNALAVPGLRDCRVFVSRRLLGLLDPAETAAVCAHELAHLEWRNRVWLLRYRGVLLALALIGLAIPLLVPQPPWWLTPAWMLTLLVLLMLLQRRQRGEESACDARATTLGVDPAALASALIKLHGANLMPRRLAAAADQSMTHPSLARRLQALRRLAGQPDGDGPAPLWVASGTGWLRLDGEGVQYHPGREAGPDWQKPFADLIELCLVASGAGAKLSLRETQGAALRLPLARTDIPAVQDHLDRVDHRLAPLPERPLGTGRWEPLLVLAILLAIYANPDRTLTPFQQLLLLVPGIAVLVTRRPGPLAILAAMATGLAAALALEQGIDLLANLPTILALGGAGIGGLWLLGASRQRLGPRIAGTLVAVSLAVAGFAWLDAGLRPWDPALATRLQALGIERASLLLPLLALAAVLGFSGRAARRFGIAIGAAALLAMAAVSSSLYPLWATATGLDPLAATPPPPPPPTGSARIAERPLPGRAFALRLSPDGQHFMAMLDTQEPDGPSHWVLGSFEGPLIETTADAADFHDGQWLVLRRATDHSSLELLDEKGKGTPAWTLRLPALPQGTEVSLWTDADRWSVEQWTEDEGASLTYRGRIGDPHWEIAPAEPVQEAPPKAACATDIAKAVDSTSDTRWQLSAETQEATSPGALLPWRIGLLRRDASVSRVTLTGPAGATRAFDTVGFVHCLPSGPSDRALCLVRQGDRQSRTLKVWTLDQRTGRLDPLVAADSGFDSAFGDEGSLLLFQPGSPDGRLVWVSPDTDPLVLEAPGAPLREVEIQGKELWGLRDTGKTSSLVRLAVPDGASPATRPTGSPSASGHPHR